MTVRRLQPAPKQWLTQFGGVVQRWFERVTLYMPIQVRVDVTLDPSSVSANTTDEQTFTVSGARQGDMVVVVKPSHTTGLGIVNARVTATDTVGITFMNATGSPIDPPSEEYRIYLQRWNEP
jgi:hypothetical protein